MKTMTSFGMEDPVLARIEDTVRSCGDLLLSAVRSDSMVDEKAGRANFVTTYDKAVQEKLRKELLQILPQAYFVGEEGEQEAVPAGCDHFIVDPIDGTTNFIKDYHSSCISVALVREGKPYYGVVYNPYLDELFSAKAGCGAYVNGKRIHVSPEPLERGIVLFGTSPYYEELSRKSFEMAYEYFQKALDIRRSGSAALDLCSVAAGRAEVFFELRLSPWDYAAGALLVTEAGGKITQTDGSPITLNEPCSILAVNR